MTTRVIINILYHKITYKSRNDKAFRSFLSKQLQKFKKHNIIIKNLQKGTVPFWKGFIMEWTKDQAQAIYKDKSNILVAAAAGSGKTAVLVERIINKILNEKIDIDKLLVVTFTNAAASEMRERILNAI